MAKNSILNNLFQYISSNGTDNNAPIVSPLPEKDTLDTPSKLYYVNQNERKMQEAQQYNQGIANKTIPEPTPFPDFEYPDWMANAKPTPTPSIARKIMNNNINPATKATSNINQPKQGNVANSVLSFLTNKVLPITRKWNIPDAVAAGQFAGEGRLEGLGAALNNFYNYMAYDGREQSMPSFPTPEAGVEAYARLISSDPRYQEAMKHTNNPVKMLQLIHKAGYASRPDYTDFIMSTPEWQYFNQKN